MTAGASRSSSLPDGESNPFDAALKRGSPQLPALPPRPMPPAAPAPLPRYGPPPPLSAPLPRSPQPLPTPAPKPEPAPRAEALPQPGDHDRSGSIVGANRPRSISIGRIGLDRAGLDRTGLDPTDHPSQSRSADQDSAQPNPTFGNRGRSRHRRPGRLSDGTGATSTALAPIGRSRRRRPSPAWLAQMPTVVTALERLLRGRVLIGLFVFWALFWLVGGVAIVRLLKMDRPAEVIPLQVGQNPEVSGAIGNTASPSPAPSLLPTDSERRFQQNSTTANAPANGFGELQPMVRPQRSGPPLGLFAGVVVLCSLGAWVRLQQMGRRP